MNDIDEPSSAEFDDWNAKDHAGLVGISDVESTIRHDLESDQVGLATLPSVTLQSIGSQPGLFEMGAQRLGMGGMGEVRLARQPALQRDVAIKRARATKNVDQPSRVLLREALVMGYLEHPNIVPIHVVGRAENEELVVAMKRIDGETLESRINSGYRLSELDANIELLIDVCKAIEFAHRKGVVHLDLKPANVMIGPYGEVYVLDWGTAVAYRDDVPETIPRPLDDGKIRGTPAYMAPEMVVADPPSAETDVYLLGGLLHALITGRGPNYGETSEKVFECAYYSKPRELPNAVPSELAAIMHKALSRKRDHRYADAGEMRNALAMYLRTRTARDMMDAARRSDSVLIKRMQANDAAPLVYAAFGATRQLYADAQTAADNPSFASDQIQNLLERMCVWELEVNDNPSGAQALLHELPRINPPLRERIQLALQTKAQEKAELLELRRQIDPREANNQKIVMWLIIGTVIAAIYAIPALLGYRQLPTEALFGHCGYLVVLAFVTIGLRDRLLDTRGNREVVGLVWMMSVYGLFVRVGAYTGVLELRHAIGLDLGLVAAVTSYGALLLDRRAVAAVPFYVAGALACFLLPFDAGLIFGLSHGVGLSAIAGTYAAFREG